VSGGTLSGLFYFVVEAFHMHMADALLSPAVGGGFWVGTFALMTWAGKKLRNQVNEKLIPLMGVLGAFVFAAQMINFTIPGTGSSGHLGGGLLLAIILGPNAAFLVIASVLTVQGLFFADGGLLALGSNIWNLGFYPCYIVYRFIYRPIAQDRPSPKRITIASVVSSVVALQLGAFSVVVQTTLSGVSDLPFRSFLLLMQPIHLAIGLIEGFVTAGMVNYLKTIQPDILDVKSIPGKSFSLKKTIIYLVILSVLTGGALSWFSSSHPDGLEWSIKKVFGKDELRDHSQGIASRIKDIQNKTAILPDYGFPDGGKDPENDGYRHDLSGGTGTSVSGLLGGAIVLLFIVVAASIMKAGRQRAGTDK